jgi:multidrug efflux pump subunit AcrA (membrane-fusion protein)
VKLQVRETGDTVQAKISKINSRVDGVSQQLEVEARLEPSRRLLPGMVATATFPGRKP